MVKYIKPLVLSLGVLALLVPTTFSEAAQMSPYSGKILLDVERRGEAWYVDPVSQQRIFLANGTLAYETMREYGLGITNADLEKIPVGFIPVGGVNGEGFDDMLNTIEDQIMECDPSAVEVNSFLSAFHANGFKQMATPASEWDLMDESVYSQAMLCLSAMIRDLIIEDTHLEVIKKGISESSARYDWDKDRVGYQDERQIGTAAYDRDTDADGVEDGIEIEQGRNPFGEGNMTIDTALVNRLKGRILLQVEGVGQAWYVHPITGQRYYMGTGADAYRIMSHLGAGAPSKIIDAIPREAESAAIHDALNQKKAPCDGFECYALAISEDRAETAVLTLESLDALGGVEMNGRLRVLARYTPGVKKDYASFELIQLDGGVLNGGDVIDLLVAQELLPEGITTEEKAQLGEDIEVIYAHLIADIPSIAPRLHCVISNRNTFHAQFLAVKAALDIVMEAESEEDVENILIELEDLESVFEDTSTRCSFQSVF